jgi:FtsP/CotA-like multicopper oxidase with cupredoxin domain
MQSRWLTLALAGAGVILAVVLFVVLRDGGDSDSTPTPTTTSERQAKNTPPKEKTKPGTGTETIEFRNGAPVGGVQDVEAASGDEVRIRVVSDAPGEVHVHGYELSEEVAPGEPATFEFQATAEGEFEIEAHRVVNGVEEEGAQIASLTVTP